jgi:hypothetical protein
VSGVFLHRGISPDAADKLTLLPLSLGYCTTLKTCHIEGNPLFDKDLLKATTEQGNEAFVKRMLERLQGNAWLESRSECTCPYLPAANKAKHDKRTHSKIDEAFLIWSGAEEKKNKKSKKDRHKDRIVQKVRNVKRIANIFMTAAIDWLPISILCRETRGTRLTLSTSGTPLAWSATNRYLFFSDTEIPKKKKSHTHANSCTCLSPLDDIRSGGSVGTPTNAKVPFQIIHCMQPYRQFTPF